MAKFLSKDGKFYMRDGKLLHPANILEVPIVTSNLTYNGNAQSPTIYGYDENTMTMGGATSGTDIGTYQITFTPKSGYEWSDDTSGTKTFTWSIKAAGSLSLSTNSLTIDANSTYGYITVTRAGDGAISATSSNTGVATVSVSENTVTVTKVGKGSATITVSVAEGTNHTAPASKTCTVTTSFTLAASTAATSGVNYTSGLPNDWNTIKEIAQAISAASDSINANTTGSIYVSKVNTWAYKITPGDTINIASQMGTHAYAVMGFNNFALTNQNNYGETHTTAGLTFGAVDCVGNYPMNSDMTNSGGWGECLMRTSTMPTLKSGMPSTLAQVKVPYVNYGQSTISYSDDYLFLPADGEVFSYGSWGPSAEARALTQFAYYKNGGSQIKSFSGAAVAGWLRSVSSSNDYNFCGVDAKGKIPVTSRTALTARPPAFVCKEELLLWQLFIVYLLLIPGLLVLLFQTGLFIPI